jgi:hypothetical protein
MSSLGLGGERERTARGLGHGPPWHMMSLFLAVPAQDFELGVFNSRDHTKAYEAHLINAEKV